MENQSKGDEMNTSEVVDCKRNDRVKVVRGRKIPIGSEGVVFWISPQEQFGAYSLGVVQDDGTKFFVSEKNVEIIVAAPVDPYANKPVIEHGRQVVVHGGKLEQDGGLNLFECGKCGREIVKATSNRTGNKYWCEVFGNFKGSRFYVKHAAHTKENCEKKQKEDQEMMEYIANNFGATK